VAAKRLVLLIFDGLGDRPVNELGNKTPLQATNTPNLDWFAANGECGLTDRIRRWSPWKTYS